MNTPRSFPCPHCRQPSRWQDNPFRPFCSERCRLIDLGAWANEDYRVSDPENPTQNWDAASDRADD